MSGWRQRWDDFSFFVLAWFGPPLGLVAGLLFGLYVIAPFIEWLWP